MNQPNNEVICHRDICFGFCIIDGDVATCPDCGAIHVKVNGKWRKARRNANNPTSDASDTQASGGVRRVTSGPR